MREPVSLGQAGKKAGQDRLIYSNKFVKQVLGILTANHLPPGIRVFEGPNSRFIGNPHRKRQALIEPNLVIK